jgi:hypothetical protein
LHSKALSAGGLQRAEAAHIILSGNSYEEDVMPKKGESVYLEFGNGKYIVDVGEYHGIPAVFIAGAAMPGKVGASAAREGHPLDKLQPNERVLTFPTTRQAKAVRDALVNLAAVEAAEALRPTQELIEAGILNGDEPCGSDPVIA